MYKEKGKGSMQEINLSTQRLPSITQEKKEERKERGGKKGKKGEKESPALVNLIGATSISEDVSV